MPPLGRAQSLSQPEPAAAPAPAPQQAPTPGQQQPPAPPQQQAPAAAQPQAPLQLPPQPQTPPQPQPQPPAETPQPETTQRPVRLPPAPPKIIDVRMPGEAGYFIGLTGWLPIGTPFVDKGHGAAFTALSRLDLVGNSKGAPGAEIGIAAGLHNSLRISYFFSKLSGSQTAPNDLFIFSQPYTKGDVMSTNAKLTDVKLSYEYLTWPYPVEARHFRLKTLWQVQYVVMRSTFDVPIKSATPDVNGNFTDFSALGSKSYFTPSFGLGFHEYATRNIHLEANFSGFALPHRFQLFDSDAAIAFRVGHIELRGGAKAFLFRTSPKADYFFRGTAAGAFVGVRWYSD